MRLIDADALKDVAHFIHGRWDQEYVSMTQIDNTTTVDAVKVVRCKECKHNSKNNGFCEHICIDANDDWYCADGEKVTG